MEHRDNRRGIALMLLGMVLFALNDALGKWLAAAFPVGEMLAVRSAAAFLVLLPSIMRAGLGAVFRVRYPGLHLARIALIAGEIACFYWAVRYLPLADVMTIYMAAPVIVTALSVPLLGERVGWRRWTAVGVGFVGVLLVLKPSGDFPLLPSLVALAGSVIFSLGLISTRHLREASGLTLVAFQTAGTGVAGAATLPFAWVAPGSVEFLLMGLLGLVALGGHVAMNRSLQLSPATVVVPFQYSSIAWAVALGFLVWGDVPTPRVALGAMLIVASGLFIFHREQRRQRATAAHASGTASPAE